MIKNLELSNFKQLSGVVTLHPYTLIKGKTGDGKSTVGEAIFWVLTGRDRTGSLTTLHLFGDPNVAMSAKVTTFDGDEIERRQVPSGGKTVKVNGSAISEAELEKIVDMPWRLFASVFFVGFFETLPETERRSIFMDATPDFEEQSIFDKIVPDAAKYGILVDWSKPSKLRLSNAKKMRNEASIRASETNGALEERTARLEQLRASIGPEVYLEKFDDSKLTALDEAIHSRAEWNAWKETSIQHAFAVSHIDSIIAKNSESERELESLKASLSTFVTPDGFEKQRGTFDTGIEVCEKQLAAKQHELDVLVKRRLHLIPPDPIGDNGECPTCGHKVGFGVKKQVAASRARIEKENGELERQIAVARADLNSKSEEVKKLRSARDALDCDLASNQMQHSREQLSLNARISSITFQPLPIFEEPSPEPQRPLPDEEIDAMRAEIHQSQLDYKAKEFEFDAWKRNKILVEEIDGSVYDLTQTVENFRKVLKVFDEVVEALHPVRGVDGKILESKLATIQNDLVEVCGKKIEFVLTELLGNGEPHDVFKLYWGGRPMALLSSGEQIAVSIAVSALLDKLTDHKIGMHFVDDSNLCSLRPWPVGDSCQQLILAMTCPEATQLTVNRLVE